MKTAYVFEKVTAVQRIRIDVPDDYTEEQVKKAYLDCSNELDWTNADLEIGYDTIEEVEILNVEF